MLTLEVLHVIVASDPALAVGKSLPTVTTTVSAALEQPVDALVTTKL